MNDRANLEAIEATLADMGFHVPGRPACESLLRMAEAYRALNSRDALEALDRAVERQLRDAGLMTDEEYLGAWATVCTTERVHDSGGTNYAVLMKNGRLPQHVLLGLLEVGRDILADQDDE